MYDVISDPRRLREWWPRVVRVEDLAGQPGAARARWTNIMAADSGRKIRMDYRCIDASRPERYAWEHELEGTPFEDHLTRQATEIRLSGSGEGTQVELIAEHTLRGSARLAGFMMKKTQRQMLDHALGRLQTLFEDNQGSEERT